MLTNAFLTPYQMHKMMANNGNLRTHSNILKIIQPEYALPFSVLGLILNGLVLPAAYELRVEKSALELDQIVID